MIDKRKKIELTIRAACVAQTVLGVAGTGSKLLADLAVCRASQMLLELAEAIKELPDD